MIFRDKEKIKKIYDETATVIADLAFKQQLTDEEMYFLLNMLEFIMRKRNSSLTQLLNWWLNQSVSNAELNEMIRNELLKIEFEDENSVNEAINNIQELLAKYRVDF